MQACDPQVGAILRKSPLKPAMQVVRNEIHGHYEVRVVMLAVVNLLY